MQVMMLCIVYQCAQQILVCKPTGWGHMKKDVAKRHGSTLFACQPLGWRDMGGTCTREFTVEHNIVVTFCSDDKHEIIFIGVYSKCNAVCVVNGAHEYSFLCYSIKYKRKWKALFISRFNSVQDQEYRISMMFGSPSKF